MSTSTTDRRRCVVCGREIEVCACCEKEDCAEAICYPDLAVRVGQSLPQPHTHGG
ncbi:MAG TPA: hypothetical protein VF097_03735 [Actinomycetota bacterium]